MVKTKLLILSLLTLVSTSLWGQTDVTETYLVNPSFETGNVGGLSTLEGWTLPSLGSDYSNISLGNSSACNGQAYGIPIPSNGDKYFYNRKGWSNVSTSLTQNVDLPAGKYYITVDYKAVENGGTTGTLGFAINGTSIISTKPFFAHSNTSGTEMANDPWKTLGAWFDIQEDASTRIEITETLAGKSARADLCLDNVRLYKWDFEDSKNYDAASAETPFDVTGMFVTNPYFDDNVNGWTTTTGYKNKGRATNQAGAISGGFWENWNSAAQASGKMYQVLSGLPDGIYRLTAAVVVNNANANVSLYIGDKKTAVTNTTASFYSVQCNIVGGSTEIGVVLGEGNAASWIGLDNIKLEYIGYDVTAALANLQALVESATFSEKHSAKSEEDLQNAIDAANNLINNPDTATKNTIATAYANLTEAIAAVTASIADYANLSQQIAMAEKYTVLVNADSYETAIQAAKDTYESGSAVTCAETIKSLTDFKVADFTYVSETFAYPVEVGEFSKVGPTGSKSEQHWSGEAKPYLEQSEAAWSQSSWTIVYSQDLTLPAGNYVFKVAGRKSVGKDCTLSLVVKNGDDVIGSISNFPEGDTGLGINKKGVTSFDPADTDGFANNGAGRGFEWRYVKFTLEEGATVNVAVNAAATASHQWVSFCDATIQTDDEANIAMIAYNIALNDANLALAADAYTNVTGQERTDLQTAIAASPGSGKEAIESATKNLKNVTDTFKAAAVAYDDFAKAKDEAVTYSEELPYANPSKKEAIATAVAVTPTSAETATAAAAAVRAAYRAYIESNAMAEGVEGAVDKTDLIVNPNFAENLDGWNSSQTGGSLSRKDTNAEPLTAADGSTYCYYDYYNSSSNNQHAQQTINNLPAGKYIFSVSARADVNLNPVYLWATGADNIKVNQIGAAGGAFGRGWNDYTVEITNPKTQDVTVGVKTDPTNGNKGGWFGFTRARLVKLQDGAVMNITDAKYATFVAPFDVTIPDGVTASTVTSLTGTTLNLQALETTIPANTPVILKSETALSQTFYGKAVEGEPVAGLLTGVYEDTSVESGYVLVNRDGAAKFAVVDGVAATVPANRAYLTVESSVKEFSLEQATGISTVVPMSDNLNEPVFNLAGQRVGKDYQGIIIKNGKKQLNK